MAGVPIRVQFLACHRKKIAKNCMKCGLTKIAILALISRKSYSLLIVGQAGGIECTTPDLEVVGLSPAGRFCFLLMVTSGIGVISTILGW